MTPLAERMRPKKLDEIVGQRHLIGPGKVLRIAIEQNHIPSIILWGPPGVGKTTLALILAEELKRPFYTLSAVSAGVKDVREIISLAQSKRFFNSPSPILFIDEIHRFNKSQQDALLGAVEKGTIVLIGATTENPSFEVNSALLSRAQVYTLEPLQPEDLLKLSQQIIQKDILFENKKITISESGQLIALSNGDARKLCNILELIGNLSEDEIIVTDELVINLVQQNIAIYDKAGEMHFDLISAFIKSIRGSDPNAALYWMARMIEGGEEVRFIARRLIILAAEDIGLANPNALLIANATQQTVDFVGWPESRIILSEAVIYLACSPKSNSAYMAIEKALSLARSEGNQPVPLHLRNAPTSLMKNLNYGQNYIYGHEYTDNFQPQEYFPDNLKNSNLYDPGQNPSEERFRQSLKHWWKEKYHY
ncbi:MAG: replication-associated recombination protein A [Bacteroidota bacterium]|nr:replication-associated recombination protein A [Bacteroidota bacterium]